MAFKVTNCVFSSVPHQKSMGLFLHPQRRTMMASSSCIQAALLNSKIQAKLQAVQPSLSRCGEW
jgi:hypothetical protein